MPHDDAIDPRINAAATRQLLRRDAGWSRDEAAEFALWRAADPRHEKAVQRLEAAQRLLRRLPDLPGAADLIDEADALCAAGAQTRSRRWWLAGSVLAAAAAVAVTLWIVVPREFAPAPQLAALNSSRTFELTDGSRVFVEGQGEIDVQFQAHERRVLLRRGEARFAVAKDAARPFVVAAANVEVRAIGTVFDVRRGGAFAEVSVSEGKVQVSRLPAGPGSAPLPAPIFLEVGQSARVDFAASTPLAADRPASTAPETPAGPGLRLKFDKTRLADVVAQFNRHSRVQLELGDAALATRPVDGTFDANQAEVFATLMAQSGELRIERLSDTRLVLRSAR